MSTIVSVVVPTFRRDESLRRCVEKLLAQRLQPSLYEIIIADDGASDSTRQVVESYQSISGPVLRYIPVTETQGPAAARNIGWRAAHAEVVAFTDDDCLPQEDWLTAGLQAIADADAATGRTIVPLPAQPTDHDRDTAGLSRASFITANCFCRRDVLREVGGFDERFTLAWREDSDLHFALLERGKKIADARHAVVVHPVRPARWGISLHLQRRGVFDPLLYRKHRELYRRYVEPLPRSYYLALFALALAVAGVAMPRPGLQVIGGSLWLGVTTWLTVRRLSGASKAGVHILEMVVTSAMIPLLSVYWRVRGVLRYRAFYL
ncbi:MAG: glycosyltransferase family 2 protein [Pirellulaceae bacterium]